MTDPTREQIDESLVHSDKSPSFMDNLAEIQRAVAAGEFVMAQTDGERIEQLEAQKAALVKLWNIEASVVRIEPGNVLAIGNVDYNHGIDVSESLGVLRDATGASAVWLFTGDIDVESIRVAEREHCAALERLLDDAKQQVQVLQDRIAKVREIADAIECANCDHPAKAHKDGHCTAPRQDPVFPSCHCSWGRGNIAEDIDAVLDGEGVKATGGIVTGQLHVVGESGCSLPHMSLPKGGKPTGRKVTIHVSDPALREVIDKALDLGDCTEDAAYDNSKIDLMSCENSAPQKDQSA